ncbi:peptidase inhibitor family I36 protein [Streptomyces sp. M19]
MDARKRVIVFAAATALAGGLAVAPRRTPYRRTAPPETPPPRQPPQPRMPRPPQGEGAGPRDCPSEYLCVYSRVNYKGQMKKVKEMNRDLRRYGGAFDHPKSAYNNGRRCDAVVYPMTNFRGRPYRLAKNTGWARIGSNLPHIWSNKWVNCRG